MSISTEAKLYETINKLSQELVSAGTAYGAEILRLSAKLVAAEETYRAALREIALRDASISVLQIRNIELLNELADIKKRKQAEQACWF
jgi:hypothetical protein